MSYQVMDGQEEESQNFNISTQLEPLEDSESWKTRKAAQYLFISNGESLDHLFL